MQNLLSNISGKIRRESLDGKEYLVAPLSMIVPGVLHGSEGQLYYPLEEISRNHDAWNGMPIVINHPVNDLGEPVSARSPDVLRKYGVGQVFNATVNGKLSAEGWFDIEKTRQLSPETLNKLLRGDVEELSTGLYTDKVPVENGRESVYNGKRYTHVARNYKPDHLAVLPGKKGACSLSDGCGVNVNEESKKEEDEEDDSEGLTIEDMAEDSNEDEVMNATKKEGSENLSASDYAYVPDPKKPSTWKLRIDDAQHVGGALAAIGKGFRGQKVSIPTKDLPGVKAKIRNAWKKFHPNQTLPAVLNEDQYELVENEETDEVLNQHIDWDNDKSVVTRANNMTAMKRRKKKKTVSPAKARKILHDGTVHGKPLTDKQRKFFGAMASRKVNNKESNMKLNQQKKDQIVERLISNEGLGCDDCNPWSEEDREFLSGLADSKLIALNKERELLIDSFVEDDYEEEEVVVENKKAATQPKEDVLSEEDWMARAPDSIRNTLNYAKQLEKTQKDSLIAKIVKNEGNLFTKEYLNAQPIKVLQGLAALATNKKEEAKEQEVLMHNYSGVSGVINRAMNNPDFASEDLDMAPEDFGW